VDVTDVATTIHTLRSEQRGMAFAIPLCVRSDLF
jgi:hypothetical protein